MNRFKNKYNNYINYNLNFHINYYCLPRARTFILIMKNGVKEKKKASHLNINIWKIEN